MTIETLLPDIAKASYFIAAVLFILGIKRMSSPVTARKGIVWAGVGMVVATLATLLVLPAVFAIVQSRAHRRSASLDPDVDAASAGPGPARGAAP